jgi:hypothetical protein
LRRGNYDGYSIRTPRWRYTQWDDGKQGEQLFDLAADFQETTDLAADPRHSNTKAALRERLRKYAQGAE